jgi:type I restriction-modification system DNA methylase subunit
MQTNTHDFIKKVYNELEFETGAGCYQLDDSTLQPDLAQTSWFKQARELNAQAIFFVHDYPTVLFFQLDTDLAADTEAIEDKIRELHLKVWNTSRVPLFFVALPGELRVYSAYQTPVRSREKWRTEKRWLESVKTTTQVAEAVEALREFSRPAIESGHLFRKMNKVFDRENRVDQWLLKNLRALRKELEALQGAKREYIHALIGRSIFIRYLEDRKILVEDYFADQTINNGGKYHCYTDVLMSKKDTYNLFYKLRKDFNGDLFPLSGEEEREIKAAHLSKLRDFLLGQRIGDQPDLFFWAYQFDIIPIELISNIYEEFYHEHNGGEDKGTHYTPTPLVDFVLSQCLTTERLDAGARVLDPACGSGIFLVEAFKRIVIHECRRHGVSHLSKGELTKLLTERIVGFDVNKSAVQVAAFSLYLAFLEFQKPPDIRKHKQLPKLVYNPSQSDSGKSLFHVNAFYLTPTEQAELKKRLEQKERYAGRADDERMSRLPVLPLKDFQFDVIVGNPPWGADNSSDNRLADKWCRAFQYPVGDRELSQCFVWRAQRLLKPNGEIGLLVSTGVLFKYEDNSKAFRQVWLKQNRIRAIYNFAHVRHVFFRKQKSEAIAPFAVVFFSPARSKEILQNKISYVSIKQSAFVERLQAVIIDTTDLHKAGQSDFLMNDWLWKTYMWGNLSDVELIEELKSCYPLLQNFVKESDSGRGFGDMRGKHSTRELEVGFELPTDSFKRNAPFAELIIPFQHRKIRRLGNLNLYKGSRIIVKRGVSRGGPKLGEFQARLTNETFAFTDDFIGFRVDNLNEAQKMVLLGILLSSLAKYYHFLTCSMWGFWHFKVHTEEHLNLPIHFPEAQSLQNRIIAAVDQIIAKSNTPTLFDPNNPGWRKLQDTLDDAIFDLYDLSETQRDLVRDLCQVTLEFFYDGIDAQAVKPPEMGWLENYRDAFMEVWHERLALRGKELETQIYAPHRGFLVGMSFELKDLGTAVTHGPITDDSEWQRWFRHLSKSLRKEYSTGIYIDSIVKELSNSSMFIIKRAERRFWTKSQARQDAQELLTEVFKLEWQRNRSRVDDLGIIESVG